MTDPHASVRDSAQPVLVRDLGRIDYLEAWDLQRAVADERAAGRGADELLLLEHHSVYTAGRRTQPQDRPTDGTPVIEVDRGGKITWHGPGQLVGYPIVRLAEPIDLPGYVRRLEEALIAVCTDLGLNCGRVEGRSGVWLPAGVDEASGGGGPNARSRRSGSGSRAECPATASRSTAIRASPRSTRSCRAGSPTPA